MVKHHAMHNWVYKVQSGWSQVPWTCSGCSLALSTCTGFLAIAMGCSQVESLKHFSELGSKCIRFHSENYQLAPVSLPLSLCRVVDGWLQLPFHLHYIQHKTTATVHYTAKPQEPAWLPLSFMQGCKCLTALLFHPLHLHCIQCCACKLEAKLQPHFIPLQNTWEPQKL